MQASPRVAAVVVSHQSGDTLDACLLSLATCDVAQVVVVDNGSTDASVAIARGHGCDVVVQDNLGFGAGNNSGVLALTSEPDYVLFLNPDAVLTRPSLERLVNRLEHRPSCAVAGPRVLSQGRPSWSAGRLATLATELRPLLPDPLSRIGPRRRLSPTADVDGVVGYVEGACFLVRRRDLLAVDGFDEGYFLYFEELDLAQRLRRRGSTVELVAEAQVEHLVGGSRASIEHQGSPHLVRSEVRYLRRWSGDRAARTWVVAARSSYRLRVLRGSLTPDEAAAMAAAAASALHDDLTHRGLAARQ